VSDFQNPSQPPARLPEPPQVSSPAYEPGDNYDGASRGEKLVVSLLIFGIFLSMFFNFMSWQTLGDIRTDQAQGDYMQIGVTIQVTVEQPTPTTIPGQECLIGNPCDEGNTPQTIPDYPVPPTSTPPFTVPPLETTTTPPYYDPLPTADTIDWLEEWGFDPRNMINYVDEFQTKQVYCFVDVVNGPVWEFYLSGLLVRAGDIYSDSIDPDQLLVPLHYTYADGSGSGFSEGEYPAVLGIYSNTSSERNNYARTFEGPCGK
jgi:hypothetical protein